MNTTSFTRLRLAAAIALAALAAPLAAKSPMAVVPGAAPDVSVEAARLCTDLFYAGRLAALVERMTPEMSWRMQGVGGLAAYRADLLAALGAETEVVAETRETVGGDTVHRRVARFERGAGSEIEITWTFDAGGAIDDFDVRPRG